MSGQSWVFGFSLWFGLFNGHGPIGLLVGVLTYAPLIGADYKVIGASHIVLLRYLVVVRPGPY